MKIYTDLKKIKACKRPLSLTIGFFDGMHKGHQKLFKMMRNKAKKGTCAVITFDKHPHAFFHPQNKRNTLYNLDARIHLLKQEKIDILIVLPFDKFLSLTSYQEFLKMIRKKLPFDHLILGKGSSFGKDRLGQEKNILPLAKKEKFTVHYLTKKQHKKRSISSTLLRQAIKEGNLKKIKTLLGRDYNFIGPLLKKNRQIKKEGLYYTLTIPMTDLILPPQGSYWIRINRAKKKTLMKIYPKKVILFSPTKKIFLTKESLVIHVIEKAT